MNKPILLCNCKNRLDAFFLKNIIQKIAAIPVLIIRNKRKLQLYVENSNFYKANIILVNQITILPSVIEAKSNLLTNAVVENNHAISTFKTKLHRIEEHLLTIFSSSNKHAPIKSLETIRVISQESYYPRNYSQK